MGTGAPVSNDGELRLDLPPSLAAGYYVVSFRVILMDSHPVAASVVFSVGQQPGDDAAAAALRKRVEAPPASVLPAYLNLALHYVTLLFAAGMALFLAWFRMPERAAVATESAMRRTAMIGIVTAVLGVGLGGAKIAGAGLSELLAPKVWAIGAEATIGASAAVAVIALLGLLLGSWFADGRAKLALFAASGMIAVASLGFTGHVVQARPTWLTVPTLILHAAMACFWFGGLWPLILALRGEDGEAAAVLEQFSRRAVVAMAVLVAAAIVLATFQMLSLGAFVATDYGLLLLGKIVLVAFILTLAAANKWRLVPAIARGDAGSRRRLRITIGLEGALGIAVVAVTAALGLTPPPRALGAAAAADPHAGHAVAAPASRQAAFITSARAGDIDVTVTATPGSPGTNAIALAFRKTDGTVFDPKEVTVALTKPDAGIEAIERPAQRIAAGTFKVEKAELVVAGNWELTIAALIDDFTRREITARLVIEPPGAGLLRLPPSARRTVAYGALSIARGQAVYAENCAVCHGTEGYGDGQAAAGLARRPADLTKDHLFHHGDDVLFDWVSNGMPDTPMPPFAGTLSEVARWDVINFLRAQAEADQANGMTEAVKPGATVAAPDFTFRIPPGQPEMLREQRGVTAILLVLHGGESAARLARLAEARSELAAANIRVVAIPLSEAPGLNPSAEVAWANFAAQANEQAVAAYTLFRRVQTVEGILDMPRHMEVLVDRQGYLRARWIPGEGEGEGWGDIASLLRQAGKLMREPPRPMAADGGCPARC